MYNGIEWDQILYYVGLKNKFYSPLRLDTLKNSIDKWIAGVQIRICTKSWRSRYSQHLVKLKANLSAFYWTNGVFISNEICCKDITDVSIEDTKSYEAHVKLTNKSTIKLCFDSEKDLQSFLIVIDYTRSLLNTKSTKNLLKYPYSIIIPFWTKRFKNVEISVEECQLLFEDFKICVSLSYLEEIFNLINVGHSDRINYFHFYFILLIVLNMPKLNFFFNLKNEELARFANIKAFLTKYKCYPEQAAIDTTSKIFNWQSPLVIDEKLTLFGMYTLLTSTNYDLTSSNFLVIEKFENTSINSLCIPFINQTELAINPRKTCENDKSSISDKFQNLLSKNIRSMCFTLIYSEKLDQVFCCENNTKFETNVEAYQALVNVDKYRLELETVLITISAYLFKYSFLPFFLLFDLRTYPNNSIIVSKIMIKCSTLLEQVFNERLLKCLESDSCLTVKDSYKKVLFSFLLDKNTETQKILNVGQLNNFIIDVNTVQAVKHNNIVTALEDVKRSLAKQEEMSVSSHSKETPKSNKLLNNMIMYLSNPVIPADINDIVKLISSGWNMFLVDTQMYTIFFNNIVKNSVLVPISNQQHRKKRVEFSIDSILNLAASKTLKKFIQNYGNDMDLFVKAKISVYDLNEPQKLESTSAIYSIYNPKFEKSFAFDITYNNIAIIKIQFGYELEMGFIDVAHCYLDLLNGVPGLCCIPLLPNCNYETAKINVLINYKTLLDIE